MSQNIDMKLPMPPYPNQRMNPHYHLCRQREGMAMLMVLLITALLSISAVPMLDLANRNKKRAMNQQVLTLLNTEAKEYLELGIYAVQMANGVPSGYSLTHSAQIKKLAAACEKRVQEIDPKLLGTGGLHDPATVYASQVTTSKNRWVGQFIVNKTKPGDEYQRFAVLSCATAVTGQVGIYGAEIAALSRSFYTLSFGKY